MSALAKRLIGEEFSMNPSYNTSSGKGGDSHVVATSTKKEGDEYAPTGEERREVALAKRILQAASGLAKTPAVEEIVRAAEELEKMHGVKSS